MFEKRNIGNVKKLPIKNIFFRISAGFYEY